MSDVETVTQRRAIGILRGWRNGQLRLTLPDGSIQTFGDPVGATHGVRVRDNRFFTRLLSSGVTGVGESYMAGEWKTDDLPGLMAAAMANSKSVRIDGPFSLSSANLNAYRQRRRFRDKIDAVRALGYDERFIRMWGFYLAACSAAFKAKHLRDVQLLLTGT